jgi:hypothetical protein
MRMILGANKSIGLVGIVLLLALCAREARSYELVVFRATAIAWVSSATVGERNEVFSADARFKLKSIQELAAIRFDPSPALGRVVERARLFLKAAGPHRVRYLRVSTISQRWKERSSRLLFFAEAGATWNYADSATKRPWAWPGSEFADVIMTSGNSLATWGEARQEAGGWISVDVPPKLIDALLAGTSDGLAIAEGGTPDFHNNYFFGVGSGDRAPYLQVELGPRYSTVPEPPILAAEPGLTKAGLRGGALKVGIRGGSSVIAWRFEWNGRPVDAWKVKRPSPGATTAFVLEGLEPSEEGVLTATAVGHGGLASSPVSVATRTSPTRRLLVTLPALPPPDRGSPSRGLVSGDLAVLAVPGLVKVSPVDGLPLDGGFDPRNSSNPVFDGREVSVFGARGEYVSFQLIMEKRTASASLEPINVRTSPLTSSNGHSVPVSNIELYRNWYSRNRLGQWQPAYAVPIVRGDNLLIPDPQRGINGQTSQSVYVDIYVPKAAPPGHYEGHVEVSETRGAPIRLPISLQIFDFELPDRLSFWTELNSYHLPRENLHDYFRLAHQHRAVFMPWVISPGVSGTGAALKLDFRDYDRIAGPLLSGQAFLKNRRRGAPVRTMYLPFIDSWPVPLTPRTYAYSGYWPRKGDPMSGITRHYERAPYIGDALSTGYKEGIHAAQQQFMAHFRNRGWNQTEMQAFYGGKNTHRINYGSNMWWTTDEPYHWDDWLALQFFSRHWSSGLDKASPEARERWVARADISRPEWQGQVLEGALKPVYYGFHAFKSPRRLRMLSDETGIDIRAYGGLNPATSSNLGTVGRMLGVWLDGARAYLPWQTLGNDGSLDQNDNVGGSAILAPGRRFGVPVVGDLRLKAIRDAQQLIEYLEIIRVRHSLTRAQIKRLVHDHIPRGATFHLNANPDAADEPGFAPWHPRKLSEFRRILARFIAPISRAPKSATQASQ